MVNAERREVRLPFFSFLDDRFENLSGALHHDHETIVDTLECFLLYSRDFFRVCAGGVHPRVLFGNSSSPSIKSSPSYQP